VTIKLPALFGDPLMCLKEPAPVVDSKGSRGTRPGENNDSSEQDLKRDFSFRRTHDRNPLVAKVITTPPFDRVGNRQPAPLVFQGYTNIPIKGREVACGTAAAASNLTSSELADTDSCDLATQNGSLVLLITRPKIVSLPLYFPFQFLRRSIPRVHREKPTSRPRLS